MYLAYLDESGDDGWPQTASPLFVQSAVYLHHRQWKSAFEAIRAFRRQLATEGRLPFDLELHTRELLLDKDPYHPLKIPPADRLRLLKDFCHLFATLEVKCINVVIHKKAISENADYNVLDTALKYLIQRLENDLRASDDRFLLITDEGRVGKMRSTARRIQRFNPVPSKFGAEVRQQEIKLLIEDPLPKKSHESYSSNSQTWPPSWCSCKCSPSWTPGLGPIGSPAFADRRMSAHCWKSSSRVSICGRLRATRWVSSVIPKSKAAPKSRLKTPPTTHTRFQ